MANGALTLPTNAEMVNAMPRLRYPIELQGTWQIFRAFANPDCRCAKRLEDLVRYAGCEERAFRSRVHAMVKLNMLKKSRRATNVYELTPISQWIELPPRCERSPRAQGRSLTVAGTELRIRGEAVRRTDAGELETHFVAGGKTIAKLSGRVRVSLHPSASVDDAAIAAKLQPGPKPAASKVPKGYNRQPTAGSPAMAEPIAAAVPKKELRQSTAASAGLAAAAAKQRPGPGGIQEQTLDMFRDGWIRIEWDAGRQLMTSRQRKELVRMAQEDVSAEQAVDWLRSIVGLTRSFRYFRAIACIRGSASAAPAKKTLRLDAAIGLWGCGEGDRGPLLLWLQREIDPHTFSSWFSRTREAGSLERGMVIAVPSMLHVRTLTQKFSDKIRQGLREIGEPKVLFQFVATEGEDGLEIIAPARQAREPRRRIA